MSYIQKVFLQDRQTATGNGQVFDAVNSARDVTVTCTSEGTTSGGTLSIEESDLNPYTGTWSVIQAINASDFTGGAKKVYHIRVGAGLFMRCRIATTITGTGTVTVSALGA